MYKVLIADDEPRVINVINILLERQFPSCFSYLKAENGEVALQLFESEQPQLVFVDIKMPGLNGIEVVKRIRKQSKSVYIVIITAFNYFEFAKDAIQAGVNDFILKPPSRDSINETVNKFFTNIEETNTRKKDEVEAKGKLDNLSHILQKEITLSLAYGCTDQDDAEDYYKELKMSFTWGFCVVFNIQEIGIRNLSTEELNGKLHIRNIFNEINTYLQSHLFQFTVALVGKKIILYIFLREKEKSKCEKIVLGAVKGIQENIEKMYPVILKTGIGNGYMTINELCNSHADALGALNLEDYSSAQNKNIFMVSKKDQKPEFNNDYYVKYIIKQIRAGILNDASEAILEAFLFLKGQYGENKSVLKLRIIDLLSEVTKCFIDRNEDSSFLNELSILLDLDEINEFVKYFESFTSKLIYKVEESKSRKRHFTVDKILKYVDENYQLPLTIEELSSKFSLSTFYFSRLFKEYKNISFVDYMTEVRINKAIEIMQDETVNIKEVSYKVGYNDPNYFSRVFKKVIGISPKEYRNKQGT